MDHAIRHGPTPQPSSALGRLLRLLDVEEIEVDLYRGANSDPGWIRVYGGQVVAQALAAAQRTVPADRPVHSLHGYFLRPGEPQVPILYRVVRERDGTSFTTRSVSAIQHGRPIFALMASFQLVEEGFTHADRMPPAPPPETLLSETELARRHAHRVPEPWRSLWAQRERPLDFRPVDPMDPLAPARRPPRAMHWLRTDGPVPSDPRLAACLLAYASDMTLLDTCLLPHAVSWTDPKLQAASLDHAIWFHGPYRPDEWHLFVQVSPAAAGARGLNEGRLFARDGRLVASVVQEGLIRYRR
ncbi:MAG: acyl-CoA thioesterase II [Sphingomonadaceae bacterium]|uniref:acyl-CoA thioesterase n=1 Tax=Thermaurantiacus sp. TaxID=2820283 RepID=UPI00298F380C|nr:acyl-CoA thioesterase II [Thermaurantiacus sp.]MCS6987715.1 acyl-CoA thioesterase II [Sphingomonadaceae bacterium]MDW8415065.1 acyl-CoA thioesterase II [Thermaurantiacus sp.]